MESDSPFSKVLDTNYIPTLSELTQLQGLVHTRQALLDSIELEFAALEKKREMHLNFIRRHRALTSPARRLPEDVLALIFLELVNSAGLHPSPHPAVTASHVCQQWRHLALNTPRLWANIGIYWSFGSIWASCLLDDEKEPFTQEDPQRHYLNFISRCSRHVDRMVSSIPAFIRRSSGCVGTLSITATDTNSEIAFPIADRYRDEWKDLIDRLFDLFKHFPKHWSRLNLNLSVARRAPPFGTANTPFVRLPKYVSRATLQSATINIIPKGMDSPSLEYWWRDRGMDMTKANLRSLTIRMSSMDLSKVEIPWSGLTDLCFGASGGHTTFHPSDALKILKSTPNLIHCSIHFSTRYFRYGRDKPTSPVPLAHLQSLSIFGDSPPIDFAVGLDTPSLTRLSTMKTHAKPDDSDESALVEWTRRYGKQLEAATVSYSSLTQLALICALTNLPNASSLHMGLTRQVRHAPSRDAPPLDPAKISPDVLKRLTPGRGPTEPCLCPKVDTFALHIEDGSEDGIAEAVVEFIERRRAVRQDGGGVRRLKSVDITFRTPPVRDILCELREKGDDMNGVVIRSVSSGNE